MIRARSLVAALLCLPVSFLFAPSVSAQSTPITVTMGEQGTQYLFEPRQITVPAGQTRFTFRNTGSRVHNWVVTIAGAPQRTPDISAGQSAELTVTFPQPGTYEAICDLPTHAQRGMRMSIEVTAASGGAPAGTGAGAATGAGTGSTGAGATSGTASGTTGAASGAASASNATASQSGGLSGSPGSLPLFISLAIHIPSAIAWLGIVLYHAIILAVPFLTPAQKGGLLRRPWLLVLITIPLFSITGIYQTMYNPFSTVTDYASLTQLRNTTAYGQALFLKHAFVFASIALTLLLTFWFAPKLVAFADDIRPEAVTPSRLPSLVAWANVAACVALLTCVAVMVYQLH